MRTAAGFLRVAAAIGVVLALSLPAVALAHAELLSSDPADGATITTTPYPLSATFSEELDPELSAITIVNAAGAQIANGSVHTDDMRVMGALLPELPDGTYTVRWTAVTPDDHAIERGTYTFTVAAAATPTTPQPTPAPTAGTTGGNDLLIALVLAGIAIGAVVAFVIVRGRR